MKIEVELDVLNGVLDDEKWARNKLFTLIEEVTWEPEPGEICGFNEAWVGICKNTTPCPKHKDKKCYKCGKRATKSCSATFALVCGTPTCDEHRCHS